MQNLNLIIMVVLVFVLIFFITIALKPVKGSKVYVKEFLIEDLFKRNIDINVLNSDIKIVLNDNIKNIRIDFKYMAKEFIYDFNYDKDNISILQKDSSKKYRHLKQLGDVIINLPNKELINNLNIQISNGDFRIYSIDCLDAHIQAESGNVKIDNVSFKDIKINKLNGEVIFNDVDLNKLDLNITNGSCDFIDVYGEDIKINILNGDCIYVNVSKPEYILNDFNVNCVNGNKKLNVNF